MTYYIILVNEHTWTWCTVMESFTISRYPLCTCLLHKKQDMHVPTFDEGCNNSANPMHELPAHDWLTLPAYDCIELALYVSCTSQRLKSQCYKYESKRKWIQRVAAVNQTHGAWLELQVLWTCIELSPPILISFHMPEKLERWAIIKFGRLPKNDKW